MPGQVVTHLNSLNQLKNCSSYLRQILAAGALCLTLSFMEDHNRVYSQLAVNMVQQPKPTKERAEDHVHRTDTTRAPDNNQGFHGNSC